MELPQSDILAAAHRSWSGCPAVYQVKASVHAMVGSTVRMVVERFYDQSQRKRPAPPENQTRVVRFAVERSFDYTNRGLSHINEVELVRKKTKQTKTEKRTCKNRLIMEDSTTLCKVLSKTQLYEFIKVCY